MPVIYHHLQFPYTDVDKFKRRAHRFIIFGLIPTAFTYTFWLFVIYYENTKMYRNDLVFNLNYKVNRRPYAHILMSEFAFFRFRSNNMLTKEDEEYSAKELV